VGVLDHRSRDSIAKILTEDNIRKYALDQSNWFGIAGILYLFYLMGTRSTFEGPWWQWEYIGVHHFFDFLVLPSVAAFMFLVPRVKAYTAAVGGWFVLGVHEILWYVSFITISLSSGTYQTFVVNGSGLDPAWFASTVQLFELTGIGLYCFALKKFPIRYIAIMLGVYTVWLAMGFHVRTGYNGETIWWDDPLTNMTEIASWAIAGISFCILEREHMKIIDVRLKAYLLSGINLLIGLCIKVLEHESVKMDPSAQGQEEVRAGEPGDRDSGRIRSHHLPASGSDHKPFNDGDDCMASRGRPDTATGSPNLRWNRYPSRHLREGQKQHLGLSGGHTRV